MTLPVCSAVLLAFCFPFISAWWLAWLALVPLYLALLRAAGNIRAGLLTGFWFGLTLHLVGVFWMSKLGTVPWLGVAVCEAGAFALWGAIAAPLLFRLPTWARPLAFAATWTCLEWARTLGAMAFPWFPLAASQVPCLPMVQIVSVTGQWGLGFAVALVNALLVEAYQARRLRDESVFRWLAGSAVYVPVALWVGGYFALGNDAADPASAPTRNVTVIQGNVGKVPENADYSTLDDYRRTSLDTYLQMTRFAAKSGTKPDFVLWPETVVPGYLLQDPILQTLVAGLARETNTDLLVGTADAGAGLTRFNSVVYLDPNGIVRRKYDKQRIVPMGEFFPFRDSLGSIYEKYNVPNEDLTPGRAPGVFPVGYGTRETPVGMLICYEAVFPYISRDRVREGARVLLQSTSDETFDGTPNPEQHADLCVLRAVETRRYFVRAGATGYSEIIDAGGNVSRRVPAGKPGTISDRVVLRTGETLFVRFGDWFVGVCAALTACAGMWVAARTRPLSRRRIESSGETAPPA